MYNRIGVEPGKVAAALPQTDVRLRISLQLGRMPPQVRRAATFALNNVEAVAFMSVREFALQCGVAPASVIRLARAAGYDGYEALRADFQARMRQRAEAPQSVLAAELCDWAPGQLIDPALAQAIETVSDAAIAARTVHVAGFRSAYSFAQYLAYLARMAMPNFRLADPTMSSVEDHLALAEPDDLVIIYSVAPYSTEAVQLVAHLADHNISTVAITDGPNSPMATRSRHVLEISRQQIGAIHSMAGCLLVSEFLLARCIAKLGAVGTKNIADFERRVRRLSGYWPE
jgi:DNA-binding MurR/RpiR family transcriptional regulator